MAFFDASAGDVAVNGSGAGPADEGDIYALSGTRVERYSQDDNGTPSDPYDDSFPLVSVWGAGVDTGVAGSGYEICVLVPDCAAGIAGQVNGALSGANALAVDQDTGVVYVSDSSNHRISAYEGDGTYLRSFGWDVVQSGTGDAGSGYEICVAANGDVCKAGIGGSGIGQVGAGRGIAVSPDGNAATGTVFLADEANHRVDTYSLDGTGPSSFGSATELVGKTKTVGVDSRGVVYISDSQNGQEIDRYDTVGVNGSIGFLAAIPAPPVLPSANNGTIDLEVDPDSDGPGSDADVLYVLRTPNIHLGEHSVVQQFGPINPPGLTLPPGAQDDVHGTVIGFSFANGLGLDNANGRLFVSSTQRIEVAGDDEPRSGIYVLDDAESTPPTFSLDSIGDVTATSATAHVTVNPNGGPLVTYRLEYSLDGTSWTSMPSAVVGTQASPQTIAAVLDPTPLGLEAATVYHVRLRVTKAFTSTAITPELTFTTTSASPSVETVGAPIRTTASARLGGRVNPRNSATTYFFEYGAEGPCDAHPCTQTEPKSAGSGSFAELASEDVAGLEPQTTYHYRLVADNGQPGSPVFGDDMTVVTRGPEAPLTHGRFPGPPGSDRAWELVSAPENGGNPVGGVKMVSDDGNRSVWGLLGGSPDTGTGSGFNLLFSERTSSGWKPKNVLPPRDQMAGPNWNVASGPSDLSKFSAQNYGTGKPFAVFRLGPGVPAEKLNEVLHELEFGGFYPMSDDGSRVLMTADAPGGPKEAKQIYDVTVAGNPQLASVLPDGTVPACGVPAVVSGTISPYNLVVSAPPARHQLSANGRFLFFPSYGNDCNSQPKLFLRDFVTQESKLISGPPLSGPACGAGFVSSTPEAAFFWTKARLSPEDTAPKSCTDGSSNSSQFTNGDVYRYEIADGSLQCVTCVVSGGDADVDVGAESAMVRIAIPGDGSRVYFQSASRLLPGARPRGTYRVDVESGDLAYVGKADPGAVGLEGSLSPDGSTLIFRSSDPSLNPLGADADNAGTQQLYRYDDNDRSLICLSCPQDGSAPRGNAAAPGEGGRVNTMPLSRDGIFAFSTPTPLVPADQNTAGPGHKPVGGTDVYEWRDGKLLLVSDGLTNWKGNDSAPLVIGMTPSGRDIIFTAATQYTPDALDDFLRLYDARIGGGFEFSKPPPPCPLEVCQGIPKGAPEEAAPGTGVFAGPGNVKAQRSKQKKQRAKKHRRKAAKKQQAKKHSKQRANHDRRSAR